MVQGEPCRDPFVAVELARVLVVKPDPVLLAPRGVVLVFEERHWALLPVVKGRQGSWGGIISDRHALATWLGVLALGDIVRAPLGIVGDNGDVAPRVRGPVRVVVSLLWALEATAVPVGVLPGAAGVVPHVLVGSEEAAIPHALLTLLVKVVVLVHPEATGLHSVGFG